MTDRNQIAALAMQALLSNPAVVQKLFEAKLPSDTEVVLVAKMATYYADALCKELGLGGEK